MKKFVFVLMPFKDSFDNVYHFGIKAACQSDKIYCERVDEQFYDGSMLDRIYNQIQHADYIIADMTERNPNVFYEVGYAHALHKKVILITQDENDIPFDLKHYHHIIYSKDKLNSLNEKIKSRMAWYLSDESSKSVPDFDLIISLNGIVLDKEHSNVVEVQLKHATFGSANPFTGVISLALQNPMNALFDGSNMDVSMLIHDIGSIVTCREAILLPDNRLLITTYIGRKLIFPKSYRATNIAFEVNAMKDLAYVPYGYDSNVPYGYDSNVPLLPIELDDCEIMISSPYSNSSYKFSLKLTSES